MIVLPLTIAKWLKIGLHWVEARREELQPGGQLFEPSFAAFPGVTAGSWIRGKAVRLQVAP